MTKQIIVKKGIALLLIQLTLVLTLNTSIVFAALNSIEARGKDNVNNFIREEDFITFKANAVIPGDDAITPDQVLLGSSQQFSSCQADISGFTCQLRFPANGSSTFDAKAIPYTVTLKNDAGNAVDTKTDNVYVDNLPPVIRSFNVDQALVSSGVVSFGFEVEDRACSASSCSGKCSGITNIEISEPDGNFKQNLVFNTGSCTVSESFETSALTFSDGPHTIIIKAYDKFNQVSSGNSVVFEIDKSAPFVDQNTFRITDELDTDLGFFGPSPVQVEVKVDIKDSDLNKNSVTANLDALNKNINLENVQASCGETENDITTCSWTVTLDPGTEGNKEITIEASDLSGNKGKTIITKNLALDDKGPAVLSLSSNSILDGKSFAKLNDNVFTATISDSGAGIKADDIILYGSSTAKAADSCSKTLNLWQCTWNDIDFLNSGKVNMFIGTDSTDRLGNQLAERFEKEIIVDSKKPQLVEIVVKGIGGSQETSEDFVTTGDKIQVQAVIEDESLQRATADFSPFIFGARNVTADTCTSTSENTFVCSWTTSSIDIDGFLDSFIRFEFIDIAGNTLTRSEPFKVLGVIGGESRDFWQSSVQCSPTLLDRETLPLINQRAFCLVSLIPKSVVTEQGTFENIEVVSTSLGECSGDTGLVESTELANNLLSNEPVIKVNFQKQDANIDELNLACDIDIISRQGNSIIAAPEKETVALSFGFYNQPLGEVSDSVQQKIDEAVKDADGIYDFIGVLNTITFYSKNICNVGNVIAQFIGLFKSWETIWQNFRTLTVGTPADPAAAYSQLQAAISTETLRNLGAKSYPEFIGRFCNFVNCKTTFDVKGNPTFDFEGPDSILGQWREGGYGLINSVGGDFLKDWTGRDPADYMNPRDSIVVASLTACIPGVIHGLDKYRQIQCMYADCLQTGVGEQGLPVFACEDQKSYATCKYIVGEVFQAIPFTALFDYYSGLIKSTLANPFKILGAGIAAACNPGLVVAQPASYQLCAGAKVIDFLGITIQEITSIFDSNTWTINEDFCDRLDEGEDNEEDSGGLFGIF